MVLQHLQVPQLEVWQVLLSCAGTGWRQRRPKYFFKGLENDTATLKACKTKMVSFIKESLQILDHQCLILNYFDVVPVVDFGQECPVCE